jgi:hypothetical protein
VNAALLAKLEADAHWSNPSPVVTLDAVLLRRLLEERAEFKAVVRAVFARIDEEFDITNSGGPNWAMRLSDEFGAAASAALAKSEAA